MAEFGTVFIANDSRTLAEQVRRVEASGFSWIGIGDTQSLYREMYVCLTIAALNTKKALIGPLVTNPITRHPAVTASAMATLDELTGGRTFLGLGTGDTALVNLGQRPATVAKLRQYIMCVKELLAGHEVEWEHPLDTFLTTIDRECDALVDQGDLLKLFTTRDFLTVELLQG